MVMTNFLQKRKSVREFKNSAISSAELEKIREYMEVITKEEASVDFVLYENGKIIYEGLIGKAGYSGVMINSPHYIALTMRDTHRSTLLHAGYYLEKLNTKLIDMGLNTCWITVDKVDNHTMKSIFGAEGEYIDYLIAFGYEKEKKFYEREIFSARYEIDEIVFFNKIGQNIDIEELENRGLLEIFSSVRYAPSHKNFQPWRFVVKDSDVYVYMVKSDEDSRSLIDIGIVMFYFEEMAKTIGKYGKWSVILEDEEAYLKIAKFTM
ncbi:MULTISPECIES: nitroreductase family protein [Peptoniphilus]|uniref:nitroreductase family protein n=1 Tax=Peptoniphilus TaxID=162289 RepID=UPI0001DA9B36|nr:MULTISPECIES: nitroreductase family protein [Peptoniphilus]EFI42128.1 hypothetical protein HMPREF0629_00768 [Peptoniphilus sp. oral taxon 386 str. F0131]